MLQIAPMTPSPETWLPLFDDWAQHPTHDTVDRELVHKHQTHNVLVARAEQVGPDHFGCELRFPSDHPFFFEHPVDHVPGLALIEAGRQMGLLVTHQWYGVPTSGFTYLMKELTTTFDSFASLDEPVFGHSCVADVRERKGVVHSMQFTGHYHQRGRSIGHITGVWTILPNAVIDRWKPSNR